MGAHDVAGTVEAARGTMV
jgi:hypothetical protein